MIDLPASVFLAFIYVTTAIVNRTIPVNMTKMAMPRTTIVPMNGKNY